MITSTDLAGNSWKAWQTIKNISNDPTTLNPSCLVTTNQVAHQLLVNGRGEMATNPKCPRTSSSQMASLNAKRMPHREPNPQSMKAIEKELVNNNKKIASCLNLCN